MKHIIIIINPDYVPAIKKAMSKDSYFTKNGAWTGDRTYESRDFGEGYAEFMNMNEFVRNFNKVGYACGAEQDDWEIWDE